MSGVSLPCGLYRTGMALVGNETEIPQGMLVYFHNHSEQGPPMVLKPNNNVHNRWVFHDQGWLVEDPGFINALISLKSEGFYVVGKRHLHISRDEIISERTLVQLGYNRSGESILFVAQFEEGGIKFPNKGYRFEERTVQDYLEPVSFTVPQTDESRLLH